MSFISFSTKVAELPKLHANHGPCLTLVKSSEMLGDGGEFFNLSEYRCLTYKIELIMGVATAEDDDIAQFALYLEKL